MRSYSLLARKVVKYVANPPIVGEYERSLSFTTITKFLSDSGERLFSASQDIPPVKAPSPTTATT